LARLSRKIIFRVAFPAFICLVSCSGPAGGLDVTASRMVADFEPPGLVVLAPMEPFQPLIQRLVDELSGRVPVLLVDAPLDSVWIRDYGPIPVRDGNGQLLFLDSGYWTSRPNDDALPPLLGEELGVRVVELPLALEGGDIVSNGEGICLSTRRILQRNPELPRTGIEQIMRDFLGCSTLVLLEAPPGMPGGHVDTFARFLDATTVLLAEVDDSVSTEDAEALEWNAELLRSLDGPMSVVRVPIGPVNVRAAPMYLNYLLAGDLVLVPYSGQPEATSDGAAAALRERMEGYDVRLFDALDLIIENGGLRCASLTTPDQ
jgi:agmatine deiminase